MEEQCLLKLNHLYQKGHLRTTQFFAIHMVRSRYGYLVTYIFDVFTWNNNNTHAHTYTHTHKIIYYYGTIHFQWLYFGLFILVADKRYEFISLFGINGKIISILTAWNLNNANVINNNNNNKNVDTLLYFWEIFLEWSIPFAILYSIDDSDRTKKK